VEFSAKIKTGEFQMKKKRFTQTQIVKILKEAESGVPLPELARKHGISQSTYYNWKAKYGGMDSSELSRLKELEAENRKLKEMFAELSLENRVLKDVLEKKS